MHDEIKSEIKKELSNTYNYGFSDCFKSLINALEASGRNSISLEMLKEFQNSKSWEKRNHVNEEKNNER